MKAYKFRAYPTGGQINRATRMLRVHCDIYNACLEERIRAWKQCGVSVSFESQCAQLPYIRAADPRVAEFGANAQQRTIRRVDRAFQGFFRRCRNGDTPGFPRFKPRQRFNTIENAADFGAKWGPTEGRWARAYFKGVGQIKVNEHRPVVGKVKTLSLTRDGRKWYVAVVAEDEPEILPPTGRSVGVDVGIARFLTASDGEIVGNPRFAREAAAELAELQRRLAACGGQSKTLRRKIAKLHRKVKNQRHDFHHQTARRLVDTCDTIVVEELNVKGMSRRAKPKPDPETPGAFLPNGGSAKTGLNKSIADVGWASFRTILAVKAENAGRTVIAVNPAYTSINCNVCGTRCERPEQSVVVCPEHGSFDADLNGAINILGRGLASSNTT